MSDQAKAFLDQLGQGQNAYAHLGAQVVTGDVHALLRAAAMVNNQARMLRREGWTVHVLPSDAVDGPVRVTVAKDSHPPSEQVEGPNLA